MSRCENLTGKKFGRLTAIERETNIVSANGYHQTRWLCKCDCGNEKVIKTKDLKRGSVRSCGCLHKELARKRQTKHGLEGTTIYKKWSQIKNRCLNPKSQKYYLYGERGIKVCDKWLKFEGFYEDMGESYDKHVDKYGKSQTTIERINVNKGYCKENYRWATTKEQSRNKRSNHFIEIDGKKMILKDVAEKYNINRYTLARRLKTMDIYAAVNTPLKHGGRH